MASEEQLKLSTYIKDVHNNLRQTAKEKGADQAWSEHIQQDEVLKIYADSMKKLALMWESNAMATADADGKMKKQCPKSRITWIIEFCHLYFFDKKSLLEKRQKEEHILEICDPDVDSATFNGIEILNDGLLKINVLDVGSCFNPLKVVDLFDVTAIDLYPENADVHKGDFLKIPTNVLANLEFKNDELQSLPIGYFHCIVFSLLLEYLPTSDQRILCCLKAYELLKYEGILIIITPDSQHVGKNAKLMKNWRYTLATIGFSRIKFEKLAHITCMVFRKSISKKICERWASIHKEDYMSLNLEIPQD